LIRFIQLCLCLSQSQSPKSTTVYPQTLRHLLQVFNLIFLLGLMPGLGQPLQESLNTAYLLTILNLTHQLLNKTNLDLAKDFLLYPSFSLTCTQLFLFPQQHIPLLKISRGWPIQPITEMTVIIPKSQKHKREKNKQQQIKTITTSAIQLFQSFQANLTQGFSCLSVGGPVTTKIPLIFKASWCSKRMSIKTNI
jgi:uncharacterized integral membrane protein